MIDADMMEESNDRRSADRKRTFKGVTVSYNQSLSAVEGVLKNTSDTGGLLTLKDGIIIPDEFVLFNDLDGWKVECKTVWRKPNSIGFKYIRVPETYTPKRQQVFATMDVNSNNRNAIPQTDNLTVRSNKPVTKPFGKLGT